MRCRGTSFRPACCDKHGAACPDAPSTLKSSPMARRWRNPLRRGARRLWLRIAAGVLAMAMLVGLLRGGARYFYCPMMRAVIDAPCCADRHAGADFDETLELRSRGCCEEHVVGKLPSGAVAAARVPCDAPLLAVLPPVTALSHPLSTLDTSRFEHQNRAGPASTARHRAALMVFLN